jgi:predicted metal-dependent HD superfamily phosphohydrolase
MPPQRSARPAVLKDQLETVLIAAWFHDTGYFKGKINHEQESRNIAENFLREQGIGEKKYQR